MLILRGSIYEIGGSENGIMSYGKGIASKWTGGAQLQYPVTFGHITLLGGPYMSSTNYSFNNSSWRLLSAGGSEDMTGLFQESSVRLLQGMKLGVSATYSKYYDCGASIHKRALSISYNTTLAF